MAGTAATMWGSLKSERFDPFVLWRAVGEDMQLLEQLVRIFAKECPGMLREIENAADAQDGAALRKASHKLKGTLLQFAAPAAASAAADLERCADHEVIENAPAAIGAIRKETDFVLQMLHAMVSHPKPEVKTKGEI